MTRTTGRQYNDEDHDGGEWRARTDTTNDETRTSCCSSVVYSLLLHSAYVPLGTQSRESSDLDVLDSAQSVLAQCSVLRFQIPDSTLTYSHHA